MVETARIFLNNPIATAQKLMEGLPQHDQIGTVNQLSEQVLKLWNRIPEGLVRPRSAMYAFATPEGMSREFGSSANSVTLYAFETRHAFALAAMATDDKKFPGVAGLANNAATRDEFRFVMNEALLRDWSHAQAMADEQKISQPDNAQGWQNKADLMLSLRNELIAENKSSPEAPSANQ